MHDKTPAETDHAEENKNRAVDNPKDQTINDQKDEKEPRFKEGQDITFVRVRFPGNAKSFPFMVGKRIFTYGQKVLAMSDRGMTVGYINSFPYTLPFEKNMLPIKSISKIASDEDIEEQKSYFRKEQEAETICIRLVEKLKLDMVITHVEFVQFGKKAVFYFNAPSRVDFRELVKQLVGELKMRIELRQISVRDRTAALGGVGACGLMTCCSSFLKNYGNVSIKMAKNQNLALIPSKINGVCGQLKCCIKYEDEVYSAKRKLLPKEGVFLEVKNGDRGKVTKLHILNEQFDMITESGKIRRYVGSQFDKNIKLPDDWTLPQDLGHIVNETSNIIGLEKSEKHLTKIADEDLDLINANDVQEEVEEPREKYRYQDDQQKNDKDENKKRKNNNNQKRRRNNNNRKNNSNQKNNKRNRSKGQNNKKE